VRHLAIKVSSRGSLLGAAGITAYSRRNFRQERVSLRLQESRSEDLTPVGKLGATAEIYFGKAVLGNELGELGAAVGPLDLTKTIVGLESRY
jgi:hypothetical protein